MGKASLDKKFLRTLSPLSTLSADKLDELASKSELETWPAGRLLFRKGDDDRRLLYLLDGQVELIADNTTRVLAAHTAEATAPISAHHPHRYAARAKTPVKLLVIDRDLFDLLKNDFGTAPGGYEVTEIDCGAQDDDEWMIRFLQSSAFATLPASSIQAILTRLEPLELAAGAPVIRQGDQDPYYYIVKSGQCRVTRRPAPGLPDIRLAELSTGDGFGEEALITGGKRNATVTMLEDGVVMRLGKDDFERMLVAPLVRRVPAKTARALLADDAALLDVRNPDEFAAGKLDGAINLPLSTLRLKLKGLHPARDYIVCCDDGHRSTAAVFLMRQQGLRAHVLEGGIAALAGEPLQPIEVSAPTQTMAPPVARVQPPASPTPAQDSLAAADGGSAKVSGKAAGGSHRRPQDVRLTAEIQAAQRAAEREAKDRASAARQQNPRRPAPTPPKQAAAGRAVPKPTTAGLGIHVGERIHEPARVRSVGDKTVLEAEADIFVFQAPPAGITTEPMPARKPIPPAPVVKQPLDLIPIDTTPRKSGYRPTRPSPAKRTGGARSKALAAMLMLGLGVGVLGMYGSGDTGDALTEAGMDTAPAHRVSGMAGAADEGWFADLKRWLGFSGD